MPSLFQAHHDIFLQTAECLVVGELATKHMVVVLNKVDQLPEEGRSKVINKAKKRLRQTLGSTKFGGCAMVPTAVKPGIQCSLSCSPGTCACFVPLSPEYPMSHMLNSKQLLGTDAVGAPAQSKALDVLLSHLCACSDSAPITPGAYALRCFQPIKHVRAMPHVLHR